MGFYIHSNKSKRNFFKYLNWAQSAKVLPDAIIKNDCYEQC